VETNIHFSGYLITGKELISCHEHKMINFESNFSSLMSDDYKSQNQSFYLQLKDGSIITNPEGKPHSVQRQVRNPDGSWRMIFEISKDQSITLPALDKDERYLIICNGIFELVHY
jgi:hypothetical protein